MPETTNQDPSAIRDAQFDKNYELLRNSEVGVILAEAYEEAARLDPRLAAIEIKDITDPDEKRYGHATPSWASETGKHQIHVRLSDLDGTLAHYQGAMDQAPVAIELIAKRMGIEPSQVTPQLMFTQSILHEMGHITEYMDYEDHPDELRERNRREKLSLPIGNTTVGKLIQVDSPIRQQVEANWGQVQAQTGAESMEHRSVAK